MEGTATNATGAAQCHPSDVMYHVCASVSTAAVDSCHTKMAKAAPCRKGLRRTCGTDAATAAAAAATRPPDA